MNTGEKTVGAIPAIGFGTWIFAGDEAVNEKAVRRLKGTKPATPQINQVDNFNGVMQMDKAGAAHAVVLREGKAGVSLEVLPLP